MKTEMKAEIKTQIENLETRLIESFKKIIDEKKLV